MIHRKYSLKFYDYRPDNLSFKIHVFTPDNPWRNIRRKFTIIDLNIVEMLFKNARLETRWSLRKYSVKFTIIDLMILEKIFVKYPRLRTRWSLRKYSLEIHDFIPDDPWKKYSFEIHDNIPDDPAEIISWKSMIIG